MLLYPFLHILSFLYILYKGYQYPFYISMYVCLVSELKCRTFPKSSCAKETNARGN